MHGYSVWVSAFQLSVVAWIVLEIWIFARDRGAARGERADRGSLRVMVLALAVGIFIAFTAVRSAPGARIAGLQPLGRVAGSALILAGVALRLWAVRTLGQFFRTRVTVLDGHRLVTAGPYRRLRHPSYTGMVLVFAGLGLGLGNWVSIAALAIASALAFGRRIPVEEAALRERFGTAWDDYARSRWRLIPFAW